MSDTATIRLPDAKITTFAGESLAQTLYRVPVTLCLEGELGVGKTTFLQGFAKKLGVSNHLTSPTYALEQRYATQRYGELLHLDLYRLTPQEAAAIVETSDDHPGIRCIEWSNRLPAELCTPDIAITLQEDTDGLLHTRLLTAHFNDMRIPREDEVHQWREQVQLPACICEHCDVVAAVCDHLAQHFLSAAHVLRPQALHRAAQLHDLLRFVDFNGKQPAHQPPITDATWGHWHTLKKQYPDTHEAAAAHFLQERGYDGIAEIIAPHGLNTANPPDMTIEQKLLFYADKRVMFTQVVSIEERFADFKERYSEGKETDFTRHWYSEVQTMEKELFPNGAPSSQWLLGEKTTKSSTE